jgi:hypothetical protein
VKSQLTQYLRSAVNRSPGPLSERPPARSGFGASILTREMEPADTGSLLRSC